MDQWLRSVGQGALEEQHHLSKTQSSRLEEHLSARTLIVLDCRAVSNLYVGDLIAICILINDEKEQKSTVRNIGILLHSLEPQLAGLVVAIVKMSFCPS